LDLGLTGRVRHRRGGQQKDSAARSGGTGRAGRQRRHLRADSSYALETAAHIHNSTDGMSSTKPSMSLIPQQLPPSSPPWKPLWPH